MAGESVSASDRLQLDPPSDADQPPCHVRARLCREGGAGRGKRSCSGSLCRRSGRSASSASENLPAVDACESPGCLLWRSVPWRSTPNDGENSPSTASSTAVGEEGAGEGCVPTQRLPRGRSRRMPSRTVSGDPGDALTVRAAPTLASAPNPFPAPAPAPKSSRAPTSADHQLVPARCRTGRPRRRPRTIGMPRAKLTPTTAGATARAPGPPLR